MNVWTIVHVTMKLKKGEEYIHHISTNLNRYDRDRYWGDGVMRKGGGLVYGVFVLWLLYNIRLSTEDKLGRW